MRRLSDSISDYFTRYKLDKRIEAGPVFEAFREAAGESYRNEAAPVRFQNGILDVSVYSSLALHELKGILNSRILEQTRKNRGSIVVKTIRYRLVSR